MLWHLGGLAGWGDSQARSFLEEQTTHLLAYLLYPSQPTPNPYPHHLFSLTHMHQASIPHDPDPGTRHLEITFLALGSEILIKSFTSKLTRTLPHPFLFVQPP